MLKRPPGRARAVIRNCALRTGLGAEHARPTPKPPVGGIYSAIGHGGGISSGGPLTSSPFLLGLWFVASMSAAAASPSVSTSRPGQSTEDPIYSVTHVGIPVMGSCELVSKRITGTLDQELARAHQGRVLSGRCIPFGGDPDAWLLLDVLVADQNRTLPVIVSALRNLGVSPKTEISFDPVQPHQDSVTIILGVISNPNEQSAKSLDGNSTRVETFEGDGKVDIGSSVTEGRQVLRFKTGDVFVIRAATGDQAAVQFVVIGSHHVEYRFRYRPRGSGQSVSGHDSAVERYRIDRQSDDGDHVAELPGHDVILRIGKLRAEWSSAGPDEGFVYYDPRVATIRSVNGIDFDKLP